MKLLIPKKAPLFFIVGLFITHAAYVYAPCDDAYIFLVYVNNLFNDNGLTFNGTKVQGFTSLIWPAFIAIAHGLGFSLPTAMLIISMSAGLFLLWATYYFCLRAKLDKNIAIIPSLALALTGDFVFYSGSGLETIFFSVLVFCLAAKIFLNEKNKFDVGSVLLCALIVLTRPEGWVILSIYIINAIKNNNWIDLLKFASKVFFIALIPMAIAKDYYGYWLPMTYYAKSAAGFSNLEQGIIYTKNFLKIYGATIFLTTYVLFENRKNNLKSTLVLGLLLAVQVVIVTVQGGDNMVGFRPYVAILPICYYLLTVLGTKKKWVFNLFVFVVLFQFLAYHHKDFIGGSWGVPIQKHADNWRSSFDQRKEIGEWLKKNMSQSSKIAVGAAGVIPYFSELPTIDMFGLNNEWIALHGNRDRTLPYAHQSGDGEYVLKNYPEIIFLSQGVLPGDFVSERELWANAEFKDKYSACQITQKDWGWIKNNTLKKLRLEGKITHCLNDF